MERETETQIQKFMKDMLILEKLTCWRIITSNETRRKYCHQIGNALYTSLDFHVYLSNRVESEIFKKELREERARD